MTILIFFGRGEGVKHDTKHGTDLAVTKND